MSAAQDTAAKILSATAELIAERGYGATTTRAIAEQAGVNEVTIFRRFGSKLGILEALAEAWTPNMAGFAVDAIPEPADTLGTLRALAGIEVRQATQAGPVAMRLVLDARTNPEIAQVMGEGPGDNYAGLVAYLAERQQAGDLRDDIDPRVMAEAFFALTSQTVMSRQVLSGQSAPPYGMDADEAAAQLLEVYLAGIGVKGKSR